VDTSRGRPGCLTRALGGTWFLWFLKTKANQDLDAEHPKWIVANGRTFELRDHAVRVAGEISADAEAIAAIRAAGGKPKDLKIAAAWIRANGYDREHRNSLRAARLLKAAADGGTPTPPSIDEEALFRAVDSLEDLPLDEAFALLVSEVPALRGLERQVVTWLSVPGWENRDARERVREILDELSQLVGPRAPGGSSLIRSNTAFDTARRYLLGKAGLLRQ
jgi:hypothetical protein